MKARSDTTFRCFLPAAHSDRDETYEEGYSRMGKSDEYLALSSTYIHFNALIWQMPLWSVAIATGVIFAAHQVGVEESGWRIPVQCVQAILLLFGFVLVLALAINLHRYRDFQSASVPYPLPKPPFGQKPSANIFLQAVTWLIVAGLLCLTFIQLVGWNWRINWPILLWVPFFCAIWLRMESKNLRVKSEIDSLRIG